MKIEYDKEADAAYIYLEYPIREVKETKEISENVIIDLNDKGQIIGLEILDASKILSKKVLLEAESA